MWCGVVWCGVLSMFDAGVRDTWQFTSSSMHWTRQCTAVEPSRGASRLVAEWSSLSPSQLDLTAPRQFGVRVPVHLST